MILGSLICSFRGHKRGRRTTVNLREAYTPINPQPLAWTYECPRCGAQWTRKVSQRKPKSKKGPTDAQ